MSIKPKCSRNRIGYLEFSEVSENFILRHASEIYQGDPQNLYLQMCLVDSQTDTLHRAMSNNLGICSIKYSAILQDIATIHARMCSLPRVIAHKREPIMNLKLIV